MTRAMTSKTIQMSGGPLDGQRMEVEHWARGYVTPYLADRGIPHDYPIPAVYEPQLADGEPVVNDRGEQVWACSPDLPPVLTAERYAELLAEWEAAFWGDDAPWKLSAEPER